MPSSSKNVYETVTHYITERQAQKNAKIIVNLANASKTWEEIKSITGIKFSVIPEKKRGPNQISDIAIIGELKTGEVIVVIRENIDTKWGIAYESSILNHKITLIEDFRSIFVYSSLAKAEREARRAAELANAHIDWPTISQILKINIFYYPAGVLSKNQVEDIAILGTMEDKREVIIMKKGSDPWQVSII